MAYWDIIHEVIRKVDDENLKIYVYTYDYEDDKEILVFDDWNSQKEFNLLLKEKMEDIPEVKQDIEDYRYDILKRDDWFIEEAVGGDEYWTFSDEGFECSECYKWHYYNQGAACSYANYFVGDGFIICEDCLKSNEEYKELYLSDKINNHTNANLILNLEEMGFERVNDYPYANGWYGRVNSPEEILKHFREIYPDDEFVFEIRKTYNPWETEFDLYRREA